MKHLYLLVFATGIALAQPKVTGVANAADFTTTVAPGSLASLFGSGLSTTTTGPSSLPLPTTLAGVSVSVNGRSAPLTYISPTQINFQVPLATATGTASVSVTLNGQTSAPASVSVAASAPGILQYGANRGVIVNPDGGVNGPNSPASAGSVVVVYLTGLGATTPPVADGTPAGSSPLSVPPGTWSAQIGGANAPVRFIGLTPGFVGLAQANIEVPPLNTNDYSLAIFVNGRSTRTVRIAVSGSADALPPPSANCVSGKVENITFSLQYKTPGLADEVTIGSTLLCGKCDRKPPIYIEFVRKLEAARLAGNNVDACYDEFGTMNLVRLQHNEE